MTRAIPATYMRGGTSRGVVFRRDDLPADPAEWDAIFLSVMGSPDANRRQLNGMGGGISSLSKVCVVGAATRDGADVDYTFAQVAVDEPRVEYAGACGNMSSAIGPFAVTSGLVRASDNGPCTLSIHDTNTGKLIRTRFRMCAGAPEIAGDVVLDGVAGAGSAIWLDFLDPSGTKSGALFASGNRRDTFDIMGRRVGATLIDVASPCVFVSLHDLGLDRPPAPDEIAADTQLLAALEELRRAASVKMRLAADRDAAAGLKSIPRIGLVHSPGPYVALSGRSVPASGMDIGIRMMSMGDPHRAVPITAALCLAAAVQIPGTVPHALVGAAGSSVRIGHPSGTTVAAAQVQLDRDCVSVGSASVVRTARRLFEGRVFC